MRVDDDLVARTAGMLEDLLDPGHLLGADASVPGLGSGPTRRSQFGAQLLRGRTSRIPKGSVTALLVVVLAQRGGQVESPPAAGPVERRDDR
ncbi:hypothetical protein [Kribbella sancticallisti]